MPGRYYMQDTVAAIVLAATVCEVSRSSSGTIRLHAFNARMYPYVGHLRLAKHTWRREVALALEAIRVTSGRAG